MTKFPWVDDGIGCPACKSCEGERYACLVCIEQKIAIFAKLVEGDFFNLEWHTSLHGLIDDRRELYPEANELFVLGAMQGLKDDHVGLDDSQKSVNIPNQNGNSTWGLGGDSALAKAYIGTAVRPEKTISIQSTSRESFRLQDNGLHLDAPPPVPRHIDVPMFGPNKDHMELSEHLEEIRPHYNCDGDTFLRPTGDFGNDQPQANEHFDVDISAIPVENTSDLRIPVAQGNTFAQPFHDISLNLNVVDHHDFNYSGEAPLTRFAPLVQTFVPIDPMDGGQDQFPLDGGQDQFPLIESQLQPLHDQAPPHYANSNIVDAGQLSPYRIVNRFTPESDIGGRTPQGYFPTFHNMMMWSGDQFGAPAGAFTAVPRPAYRAIPSLQALPQPSRQYENPTSDAYPGLGESTDGWWPTSEQGPGGARMPMSTASFTFPVAALPIRTINEKDSTGATSIHDHIPSKNTLGLNLDQPGSFGWTGAKQLMDYNVQDPSTINGNQMWISSQLLTGNEGADHPRQALVEREYQAGTSGLPSNSHSIQQADSSHSHDLDGIPTPPITPDRKKPKSKEGRKRQMYLALPLSPQKAPRKRTKGIRKNYRRCEKHANVENVPQAELDACKGCVLRSTTSVLITMLKDVRKLHRALERLARKRLAAGTDSLGTTTL